MFGQQQNLQMLLEGNNHHKLLLSYFNLQFTMKFQGSFLRVSVVLLSGQLMSISKGL